MACLEQLKHGCVDEISLEGIVVLGKNGTSTTSSVRGFNVVVLEKVDVDDCVGIVVVVGSVAATVDGTVVVSFGTDVNDFDVEVEDFDDSVSVSETDDVAAGVDDVECDDWLCLSNGCS